MKNALDIIHDEHRALAAVLNALDAVVAGIGAGKFPPDFALLSAMLDYIGAVPEQVHHPKEDGYLFARLRLRAPEAAVLLDELEAEHRHGPAAIAALARALQHYQAAGATALPAFRAQLAGYLEAQWQHMNKEERQIMPLARQALLEQDWNDIHAAFAANGNPWQGAAGEYAKLFSRIVNLAPAPIGLGPAISPNGGNT